VDPGAILDLFAGLGPIRLRRMFGAQGVYLDEVMFALAAGGELYLIVDAVTLDSFRAAGSHPFTYERQGRTARLNYWRLPDAAMEDPDEAARWARLALDAARRSSRKRPKTRAQSPA
jgi:DNA transformation protein